MKGKNKTMKRKKKPKLELGHNEPNFTDTARDEDAGNVYIYYNLKTKIMLFVDAENLDEACEKFDLCNFPNRAEWKIFLEVGSQPADGPQ